MDPRDVSALREFASHHFLIVVRCPRTQAPSPDGARRAEPRRPRPYGGPQRAGAPRTPQWPACDLMSVWKLVAGRPEKVRIVSRAESEFGGEASSREATAIVLELNSRLVARVRHGAQDDAPLADRPAVTPADRFIAFGHGGATFLADAAACAAYYRRQGLDWPHD
jgi:hypothetical protein